MILMEDGIAFQRTPLSSSIFVTKYLEKAVVDSKWGVPEAYQIVPYSSSIADGMISIIVEWF